MKTKNTFNQFLIELPQNTLYKDFKKSIVTPVQLPLPFEFTDEFFDDKKEQIDHALRQMNHMLIGYEFELYLEKQIDDENSNSYDDEESEYETTDFFDIRYDYMDTLQEYFSLSSNRRAYQRLENAYLEWRSEQINEKASDSASDELHDLIELGELNKDKESKEYLSVYNKSFESYRENLEDNSDSYTFDEFVDYTFGSRELLSLIHQYDFEGGYGFYNGEYILNIHYPEVEEKTDNVEHFNHLKDFLEDKIDKDIEVLENYHGEEKQYATTWYIEPDGSLHSEYDNYFPVEITTSTYPAYQFKELFKNVLTWVSEYSYGGVITDKTTGFHFSVSFSDSDKPIDFIKMIILGKDTFWMKKLGREFNNYCKSQYKNLYNHIQYNIEKFESANDSTIEELIQTELINIQTKRIIGANTTDKFMSVNLSKYYDKHYIEFRLGGNRYYKNQQRILELIEWNLRLFVAAATPNLFKKEYHLALINMIADIKKKNTPL